MPYLIFPLNSKNLSLSLSPSQEYSLENRGFKILKIKPYNKILIHNIFMEFPYSGRKSNPNQRAVHPRSELDKPD
jgi:hypothetical protein